MKRLALPEKCILLVGLVVLVASLLYPPWYRPEQDRGGGGRKVPDRCMGYAWFYAPPPPTEPGWSSGNIFWLRVSRIDFERLNVQGVAIVAATGAGILVSGLVRTFLSYERKGVGP